MTENPIPTEVTETPTEVSFFKHRLAPLGVTDANNQFEIFDSEAEFPRPSTYEVPIFSEDRNGNIQILYWTIEGELIKYFHQGDGKISQINGRWKNYMTKRLKEPKGDMKYSMPQGQPTAPWFHPNLVQKYKDATPITTLYLTEGVFKGWAGCENGVDVVALSSITHYGDSEKKLHGDIVRLIETCQVQNIVVLWDGDCLNISDKDLTRREPLTRRPTGFYKAAKTISLLVSKINFDKTRQHPSVYLMHPNSENLPNRPKGLDDVLVEPELQKAKTQILIDLKALNTEGTRHFSCVNITESSRDMYRHFYLHDVNVFYDRHKVKIGLNEFYFHADKHKYNDDREELELLMPGWAQTLRWIGDDFFDLRLAPGAVHERRKLIPIKIGTLKNLYGADFLKYIKNSHHVAFTNVPDHFDYQEVLEKEGRKYYNRYFPFRHVAAEGNFPKTIAFLKHIFGDYMVKHKNGKEIKSWELGLDYVQHLLLNPTQILPVIVLYSPENNTGKSTYGKWLHRIFGDNAVFISNHDLQSEFNDTFADKLLAICEETLLERKKEAERIKALSTQPQILVNTKGVSAYSIDFFCKFQFYSNNKRMIYVTKHDERFWIIQVPKSKVDNPRLLDEMTLEIPAFINFLKTRELATANESRMWFHPSLIRTQAFEETVKVNEPSEATNLREELREMFLQEPDMDTIEMTMKDIQKEFFSAKTSQKWITEILKDYLLVDLERDDKGVAVNRRGKYTKYELCESKFGDAPTFEIRRIEKPTRGRHYVFNRTDLIDPKQDGDFTEGVEEGEPQAPKLFSQLEIDRETLVALKIQHDDLRAQNRPRTEVANKIEKLKTKIAEQEEADKSEGTAVIPF